MSSVTLPGSGGSVSFKYDPFGRRIYKSSPTGTSIYAYDGDDLIEEVNNSGRRVAQTIDSKTLLGAAYAGFACAGLEQFHASRKPEF